MPTTLPKTRDALLVLHEAARRRRAAAELGSDEYREAAQELATIEVRIAEIEQPRNTDRPKDAGQPAGSSQG